MLKSDYHDDYVCNLFLNRKYAGLKTVPTVKGNVLRTKEKHYKCPAFLERETQFSNLSYVKK